MFNKLRAIAHILFYDDLPDIAEFQLEGELIKDVTEKDVLVIKYDPSIPKDVLEVLQSEIDTVKKELPCRVLLILSNGEMIRLKEEEMPGTYIH